MTNLERIKDVYAQLSQGKALEAFDLYYADDVVMLEVGEPERVGKAKCREYEVNFFSSVEAVHGAGEYAYAADEANGVTMVEGWMDVTFKGGTRVKMEQVAVQYWKDGKIIREKFYHK